MSRIATLLATAVVTLPVIGFPYAGQRSHAPLNAADYAIYSLCLRDALVDNPNAHDTPVYPFDLVINADVGSRQLRGYQHPFLAWLAMVTLGPFAYTDDHARWEFWVKSFVPARLEHRLDLGIPYSLITEEELAALGWGEDARAFNAKYPRNIGLVELSRIG